METICPYFGAMPVVEQQPNILGQPPSQQQKLIPVPCLKDKCAIWDHTHKQCSEVTKTKNIEQLNDTIFKLVQVLSKKGEI